MEAMPRLQEFFIPEMARGKGDAILATLDWAAQQKGTFTIKDLYRVYVSNGGRANSEGDNIQSFSTQINKYIAKPWKDDQTKYGVSEKRPMLAVKQGSRGGGGRNPTLLQWGLDKPLRDPGATRFVEPEDDNSSGDAMDRLEKTLSHMGKGLPSDQKQGRQRLQAAIERWKKMKSLNQVVADIRGTIPKAGQMDALHIASEFLMDRGAASEDDVDDAEDQVAPSPQAVSTHDDDDDVGDFSDAPDDFEEIPDDEYDEVEDDEPPPPAKKPPTPPSFSKPAAPPPSSGVTVRKKTPEPEPEGDGDDVEEPTKQQAGAANFVKADDPKPPAPKKSPLSKFFKR